MEKLYLILSDFEPFDKGTILLYENNKLTDVDNDKYIDFNGEIEKSWIEISSSFKTDLKSISKEQRLDINNVTMQKFIVKSTDCKTPDTCESSIQLKHSPSNIFLHQESVFDDSKFKNSDDDTKRQLVKIRCKKDMYGTITKTYEKYAAVTLLRASEKIVNDNSPECKFNNNFFDKGKIGVMVDEDYVETITGNLIYVKDRSIVDDDVIFSNTICACGKFPKNEYVKFIDGDVKKIGQIQNCRKINEQHCLEIKILGADIKTDKQEKNVYIREMNAFKRDLKAMITYYEGVVIDPTSILKMENCECDSLKVDEQVVVTLRDSGELYNGSVAWLGKVNNVTVAAIKSATTLTNFENLMFHGKFGETQYFENTCYIVPVSMAKKVLPENKTTCVRIKEIIECQTNNVTEGLYKDLQLILDNVDYLRGIPLDCFDKFLTLTKVILKNLSRTFISQKLKDISKSLNPVIEDKDKMLLDCSVTVLHILCNLCFESGNIVTKIYSHESLKEVLELIFKKLFNCIECLPEIKGIFADIMFVFWSFIKIDNKSLHDWISNMSTIFNNDKVDENIKLLAALNVSFLMDSSFDCKLEVVKYLKESQQRILLENNNQKITENDILLGLGKIFHLCDCSLITDRNSDKVTLPNVATEFSKNDDNSSNENFAYAEAGFCSNVGTQITSEEYKHCIKAFVDDDKSEESFELILNVLAKLNDDEIFPNFIKKQKPINFEKYHKLISDISCNDKWFKAILDNCDIEPSSFVHAVEIADCLVKKEKTSNIEQIFNKINKHDSSLDLKLLCFAYEVFKHSNFDIFKMALSKCTDFNQYLWDGETLLTLIIQKHSDQDNIIKALEAAEFDINIRNQKGKSPIKLAQAKQLSKVFDFLWAKGPNKDDFYSRD